MLDDINVIKQKDPDGALEEITNPFEQLKQDYGDIPVYGNPKNIVVAGMGGSALSARVVKNWLIGELKIPFEVVSDYNLPGYVGEDTLFVASSYSGNTEETVTCLKKAMDLGAQIFVIAHGGLMEKLAKKHKLSMLQLPTALQPRYAVNYGVKALADIFYAGGLIEDKTEELNKAAEFLDSEVKNFLPEVNSKDNPAKRLAVETAGKTAVILSGPRLNAAAYKWKISFNENSKNIAYNNELPEFNHNEILGWTSHPIDKPFEIIQLRSSKDHSQVQKRFDATNKLLSGQWPHPVEIHAKGESHIQEMLWSIMYGDFTSIYLAIVNGNNPTPVPIIEKLKKEL